MNSQSPENDAEKLIASLGQIGEYRLLEPIGRGGMGIVFKAVHLRLKRFAAIKFVRPDLLTKSVLVRRFLREVESLGQFDHPHVLRAYEAGESDGQAFLVMEYVDGSSASELLHKKRSLPIWAVCQIIHDAALGLHHIHGHKIVHRDIKPSNLLISRNGTVKVSDLGLARKDWEDESALTHADDIVGTVDFISPEMLTSKESLDYRADIYSLGCTLYFLLTGYPPFHGEEYSSVLRKVYGHAHDSPPAIETLRTDLPADVAAIVCRALQKQPSARFQTTEEMAAALATWCSPHESLQSMFGDRPNQPSKADQLRVAATTKTLLSPNTQSNTKPAIAFQSWRWFAAVTICMFAVISMSLLAFATRNPKQNSSDSVRKVLTAAEMENGKYYSLLDQPPRKVIWPKSDFNRESKFDWEEKTKQVSVQSYGLTLLSLITVPPERDSYMLEIKFNQPAWGNGEVGLFFGLEERQPDSYDCRVLTISRNQLTEPRLLLSWEEHELDYANSILLNDREKVLSAGAIVQEPAFGQEATLELWVQGGSVIRIKWNGLPVDELINKEPEEDSATKPTKLTGVMGIWMESTSVDVLEAKVKCIGQ